MPNCSICSYQLIENSVYCGQCGASIEVLASNDSNQNIKNVKPKRMSTMFIVFITFMLTTILIVGTMGAISSSLLKEARQKSNQFRLISILKNFADNQKAYNSENKVFGTIDQLEHSFDDDLNLDADGYVFYDLIKEPNSNFYAVLATPKIWDLNGNCHYVICNTGVVRQWQEKDLPFDLSLAANQRSIDIINKLLEAH